jgi:16S rRNA (guanine527-N7)-methyltransferase
VGFVEELESVLPEDLPERADVVRGAARHLELIAEANQQFNLTRIEGAREAAIKHVLDSVMPWRFFANAGAVLDAGTGAGFPGIPLALTLPGVRFTLVESIGKKARFVEGAIERLGLANARLECVRAEEITRREKFDVVTARAMAPLARALDLFGPALRAGTRLVLFKGPDTGNEIAEAGPQLRKAGATAQVLWRYELPEALGTRTILEVAR